MSDIRHTMVCVTKQITCERLIKTGAKLQEKTGGELHIVHVAPEGYKFLGNSKEGEALDYLFEISKAVNGFMTVLRSTNVEMTIVEYCNKNNIGRIVLGESLETHPENNMIARLSKKLCDQVEIKIVPT